MRPVLSSDQYHSAAAFESESYAIFNKLWILAAIRPMLANHNDFRTLRIAGVPLVLQNSHGVVRAFANICRHRGAAIQTEEFGNRPLSCRYHHWSYDASGALQHAHKDPSVFGFTTEEMADIRLREYKVETVGGLIFVNLDTDPIPIEAQFSAEALATVSQATAEMDSAYVYTRYPVDFNWKIGIENIKDPLHVLCLHKTSFPEAIKFQVSAPSEARIAETASSSFNMPLQRATSIGDSPIDNRPDFEWQSQVLNLDSKGYYRQIALFPNVNLMIVDGTSFAIQIYNPLAADRTEMQMMVALTRSTGDLAFRPVVLWEHLKSDMAVLQEDIDCLERLQANFAAMDTDIIHGAYELGILEFQAACLSQIRRVEQEGRA